MSRKIKTDVQKRHQKARIRPLLIQDQQDRENQKTVTVA